MADRLRLFQDVQPPETRIPSFHLPPCILTSTIDSDYTFGYERREESSFASLTERASRDGSEGILGVGRPPVASIFYTRTRYPEGHYELAGNHETVQLRPFTSMDGSVDEQPLSNQGTGSRKGRQLHRRNVAEDPALEIAMTRSRLRAVRPPIPQAAQVESEPSRGRASTLKELNILLDDAIESHSPKPKVSPDEQPANLAPKPGFVLRRVSTQQDQHRHRSPSRPRLSRKPTQSVEPRTSEESARVDYNKEDNSSQPVQDDTGRREAVKSASSATPRFSPLNEPSNQLSPVKQRAAMFESLNKKPAGHDSICQHFGHEHDASHNHVHHHPGPPRKEPKKVHRIKFGDRIEERPATPLIPLTLPTLVANEKTSRPPSVAKKEEKATKPTKPTKAENPIVEESTSDDVCKKPSHERKTSLGWPFKWGLFNKGTSAQPQETMPIPAEAEAKDQHYPTTRPSVVRSKVQEILQAAEGKSDEEQRRRDAESRRLSRRSVRALPPRRQAQMQRHGTQQEKIFESASGKSPEQEQNESLQPLAQPENSSRTLLQRAMSEKQILEPPSKSDKDSDSGGSPRKSLPPTPVRGRPSVSHRPTSAKRNDSVEQQFNLSPNRDVSRQRQGVKVEVEIRDSPEREARERGDKIVIIRADVASDMD